MFEDLARTHERARWVDAAVRISAVGVLVAVLVLATVVIVSEYNESRNSLTARAVANLTELVRENPDNPRARVLLADALAADGRYRQAYDQYQAALTLSPDDPTALAGLANLAMVQDDWRTAEGYWLKIIELLSANQMSAADMRLEKAYFYLGTTYMELKEYEDAARALREALRMQRDASDTHFLLGIAYREMGIDTKFRDELETALMFDPLMADANYEYALLLLAEGDEAAAAEHFRLSVDNAPPDRREPFDELAKFGAYEERLQNAQNLFEQGDADAALAEARIAVALDPTEPEATRLVAILFEEVGESESAIGAWESLMQLEPRNEEATTALERLHKAGN